MGCGPSTLPDMNLDTIKDTIMNVMSGKSDPDMLEGVLNQTNVNMPFDFGRLGTLTPLLLAASKNNFTGLRSVLGMGADVSATDDNGNTALQIAVRKGNMEIIDELIKAGSDVNQANTEGVPPLTTAINENDTTEVLDKLIKEGASVNYSTPEHPLGTAAKKDKPDAVEMLLQNGADPEGVVVDQPFGDPVTLLAWATDNGYTSVVNMLESNAAVDTPDAVEEIGDVEDKPQEEAPADEKAAEEDKKSEKDGDKSEKDGEKSEKDGEKSENGEREGGDGEEQAPVTSEEAPAADAAPSTENETAIRPEGDGDVQVAEEPAAPADNSEEAS